MAASPNMAASPKTAASPNPRNAKKGDPNPFVVGKGGYQKFVDVLYACSEVNVARRKST